MTIPERPTDNNGSNSSPNGEPRRVRRPAPARTDPIRAALPDPPEKPGDDPTFSESVAHAVRTGYDVVSENIRLGREAAERFRHGEYNIRDVPNDLNTATMRVLTLARELSTTTIDVCARLLKEAGSVQPPHDRSAPPPPFHATPASSSGGNKPLNALNLTIRFDGAVKAVAHPALLTRPPKSTKPTDISVTALTSRTAGSPPITGVNFGVDLSVEGLIATVYIDQGQPSGVYSGMVYAEGVAAPIGVLTIEVPKA